MNILDRNWSVAFHKDTVSRMNIARLRKSKGWSQVELAEIAGTTQPTISRMEKGTGNETISLYREVASALEVPLYTLFLDDTGLAEINLVKAYRSLHPERQKGWQDMAVQAIASSPAEVP